MSSFFKIFSILCLVTYVFASCSPGEISANSTTCVACPMGYECPDGFSIKACGPGTYGNAEGLITCLPCKAGYISTQDTNTECTACPEGTFSPKNSSSCSKCLEGTYSDVPGLAVCKKCPPGTENPEKGATSFFFCKGCPRGRFSQGAISYCRLCQPGTFSGLNSSDCTPCPMGSYSDTEGSSSCYGCPAGTFSNQTGLSSCFKCPYDTFASKMQSTSCTACPEGKFSNSGFEYCVACDDVDNAPLNDAKHPSFVIQEGQTSKCYFECPPEYNTDSEIRVCVPKAKSADMKPVAIGVGVGVGVSVLAAIGTVLYCKFKKGNDETPDKKKKSADDDKIEIKIEDGKPTKSKDGKSKKGDTKSKKEATKSKKGDSKSKKSKK